MAAGSQAHDPVTGTLVVTLKARSIAARPATGIDRLNWSMIGAAIPTVSPSPIVVDAETHRFAVAVVKPPVTGVVPPVPFALPAKW